VSTICYIYIHIQCVPYTTEPRNFFNNFTNNEVMATTTETHYRHTLQTHTTETHYRHTLQTHTTDTFLFISHTRNVLLFKFICNIFIDVRIIKEMPGSVASGTPYIYIYIYIYIYGCNCICFKSGTNWTEE